MRNTHIWTNQSGVKKPLELMDNEHIKAAYRRCWETIYGNEYVQNPDGYGRSVQNVPSPITKEFAEKWIPWFEAEAVRRRIKLTKPNRETYYYDLGQRIKRKENQWEKNKKFDEL